MKKLCIFVLTAFFLSACVTHPSKVSNLTDDIQPPPDREQAGRITQITGDRLAYSLLPSGRLALTVEEVPREWPVIFTTEETGDRSWVYPDHVRAHLNAGSLDRAFFDIQALVEQGLTGGDDLPVILVLADDADPAELTRTLPGVQIERGLDADNALAVTLESDQLGEFWSAVTSGAEAGAFARGIERVLLDHGEGPVAPAPSLAAAGSCDASEHRLTVQGIRRNGQPAAGAASLDGFDVLNVDDASIFSSHEFFTAGSGQVCVPPGAYSVLGLVNTYDAGLEAQGFFLALEWVMVGDPEIVVDADKTIVLDAREASEMTFTAPEPTERVDNFYRMQWHREAAAGGGRSGGVVAVVNLDNHPAGRLRRFAAPTTAVAAGGLELLTDARLVLAGQGPDSPVLYDLAVIREDQVPVDLDYQIDTDELAAVTNRLYSDILPQATMKEIRHFWRPWQQTSVNAGRDVRVRSERIEYLTGGDTRYQQRIDASGEHATIGPGRMDEAETVYQPDGRRKQTWFKQPQRPGVRELGPGAAPVVREGNTLTLLMPEWVDSEPGHFGSRHSDVDTTAFRFFRDGELVATASRPRGDFPMVPEPAEYRLELDIERDAPWKFTSTRTRTAWTLRSENPGVGVTQIVPLMLLDYVVDLDLGNNTTADSRFLDITARYQAGSSGPSRASARALAPDTGVHLSVSRDDGFSWQSIPGQDLGEGRFRFDLQAVHAIGGFVSLRADARDRAGNRIEQEIIRAYSVPEHIPPSDPPPVDK